MCRDNLSPKVLLIHGFLGCPEDWEEVQRFLPIESECLSLPGHGGRPLEDVIHHPSTLVGYSMGGRLALHFALKHPEKVEKLIILSANPGLESGREKRHKIDEAWAQLLEEKGLELFLEKWYAEPLFKGLTVDSAFLERRMKHDPVLLAKTLREMGVAYLPNLWPRLKKISCPLVFLFGENDIKYRLIQERLEKDFPTFLIPGCGHAMHLENPKQVAKHIMEAL